MDATLNAILDFPLQVWIGLLGVILTAVVIYLKWRWDRPTVDLFPGSVSSYFNPLPGEVIVETSVKIRPRNRRTCTVTAGEVVFHPAAGGLESKKIPLSQLFGQTENLELPLHVKAITPKSLDLSFPVELRYAGSIEVRLRMLDGTVTSTGKEEIPLTDVPDDAKEEAGIGAGWWPFGSN
jgi:hypothetical protein